MDLPDRVLAAIAEAKGSDLMAPVEVFCAIGARRLRLEMGRRASLANVRVHAGATRRIDLDTTVIAVGPLRASVEAVIGEQPLVARVAVGTAVDVRGVRIVSCTDAGVEARVVVDALRRYRLSGVAWSSMAVAIAVGSERRMADACHRASIPVSIGRGRQLSQSCAGRFAVGLCDVIASEFSRASVSAWWASAPLIDPATSTLIPLVRWERASRIGRVVGGDDWEKAQEPDLLAFISLLRAHNNSHTPTESILAMIGRLLPAVESAEWFSLFGEHADAEGEAVDVVRGVLSGLKQLAGDRTPNEVREALFDALGHRHMTAPGRIGEGIQIDRLENLATGTFRVVALTGMTEAALPRADDLRAIRVAAIAQLLCPTDTTRIITIPRVDPRGEREAFPSPLVLSSLGDSIGAAIDGATIHDDPAVHGLPVQRVDSFEAALLEPAGLAPLDEHDVLIRALSLHVQAGGDLLAHPEVMAGPLENTLRAGRARRSTDWTAFDGRLVTEPDPLQRPWAVTAIESFHICPLRVFLQHALRAAPLERPEENADPNSRATGVVVHEFLDRLVKHWLRVRAVEGAMSWSSWLRATDRALIQEVWEATAAAQRRAGLIQNGVLWDAQLRWIQSRLDSFIAAEANDDQGFEPVASEIGAAREAPWHVDTPVGQLQVTGRADRIDSDGPTLRVIDFKTGRLPARSLADPLEGGTSLQLPLYAAMYESIAGVSYAHREGRYVNPLRASAKDRSKALVLTDVLDDAVAFVSDFAVSYARGDFRYRTGPSGAHCKFCHVKASCPVDRTRAERRKRSAEDAGEIVGDSLAQEHDGLGE